ncbi:hypothetical protein GCM10023178_14250 [Actinomadura luteofluorescens]
MTGHDVEGLLAARVLDALLREDYAGLRRFVRGNTLELPGRSVRLVEARPAFLSTLVVDPGQGLRLRDVFHAVRLVADPRDDTASFERECREALATIKLHDDARPAVHRRLGRLPAELRTGPGTFYETLAAYNDHPVHPAGRSRSGLSLAELSRYAPEFAPSFPLRWAAVRNATRTGTLPGWWPAPSDVGLRLDDVDGALFPVHPLAARQVGSLPGVSLAPDPYLQVTPTLSMRTVAAAPLDHVKMPLPTSTLGLRNRRTIMPGTLPDGALVERILRQVLSEEPSLPVLLADEQTYGHADDPLLGYLVRPHRPCGGPTRRGTGPGSRHRTLGRRSALRRLPVGAALLERHAVPVRHRSGGASAERRARLGRLSAPPPHQGQRRRADRPVPLPGTRPALPRYEALARVFVTITLHLCAAAPALGLAERGLLPWRTGLRMIRERLDQALGPQDAFLRARTLDAGTLPGKAMVTAGTLVDKARTGAADINKHYGPPGPNYLLDTTCC